MAAGPKLALLSRWSTAQHADSVEFYASDIFTVGTYHLREDGKRDGSILLLQAATVDAGLTEVHSLDRCELPGAGVFDLKWSPRTGGAQRLLAAATADGRPPQLFTVVEAAEDEGGRMKPSLSKLIDSSDHAPSYTDSVCLSVSWSTSSAQLAASYNHGELALYQATHSGLQQLHRWEDHSGAEVWVAAHASNSDAVLFSGGDDCALRIWDVREDSPAARITKRFDMGVTTIAPHMNGTTIAVGSYDESVTLWDLRQPRSPFASLPGLGGGIWRIKWHPTIADYLLVAAMRGGFHLLHQEDSQLQLCATHMEPHTSEGLSYGIDWILPDNQTSQKKPNHLGFAACASFYDALLTLVDVSVPNIPGSSNEQ